MAVCIIFNTNCVNGPLGNAFTHVSTVAGANGEFGEPFGIAVKDTDIYVSDGVADKIFKIDSGGTVSEFSNRLNTPSGIAIDKNGDVVVADTGSNTIKKIDYDSTVITVAGKENTAGETDGVAWEATFNGPTGIAVAGDTIYVADTYNDRIRVIHDSTSLALANDEGMPPQKGYVVTLAGGIRGYADGVGASAQFDSPLGIALWGERLLVADAGNCRIRVIEPDSRVWTLAGNGCGDLVDGLPYEASFARPTAITVSPEGVIYVADGNSIRSIGRRSFPFVETISNNRRGFRDGNPAVSQFNRPSGLVFDKRRGLVVADSDNRLVRIFEIEQSESKDALLAPKKFTAEDFRQLQPPRWPYDPPDAKRDIAGTLGEIRGELKDENSQVWFHNGLDIAGAYGEMARFVRAEKTLDPLSTQNFDTLRELIRLPTMGYIHIRLGRDQNNKPFGDPRFIFSYGFDGKLSDVRVPRGAKFNAGEPIGTLNAMNHVHLIAGSSGAEMNALDALELPYVSDSIAPSIEDLKLFEENWKEIETEKSGTRIKLTGKIRIVVRAFDRMDGNSERRKLGVYKLGYQLIPANGTTDVDWSIIFDRNPPVEAVRTVYAKGSKSGATGETIFNYIVTNRLNAGGYSENFFDPTALVNGTYTLRVFAADFFGNQTFKDIQIEVNR